MAKRQWITKLDKLIVGDLFKTLLAALSTIVIIIVSREFVRVLSKAVKGEVSNETITSIFALKMISAISSFLPAAFFMAVLMVLGRMYRDHEMTALSSAGFGIGKLFRSVFLLIIPLALASGLMSFFAAPWANAQVEQMIHKDQQSVDLRGISAGRFSEYQRGDLVFYVQEISKDKKLKHVFVQDRLHGKLGIIVAKTGEIRDMEGGRYLVLMDGERFQGEPGDVEYVIEKFSEYALRLEAVKRKIDLDREAISTQELLRHRTLVDIAELQTRLAVPFGVIILGTLAIPMAYIAPRGGIYGNLFIAFLIYFLYANIRRLSNSWVIDGAMPAWPGFFGIYFLMVIVIFIMVVRLYGLQWLKMTFNDRITL